MSLGKFTVVKIYSLFIIDDIFYNSEANFLIYLCLNRP